MKACLGYQYTSTPGVQAKPVYWDSKSVLNGHILIFGESGAGKSVLLRRMLTQSEDNGNQTIHVFDIHGDLKMDGESVVEFSEQSIYGLNPLIVNPNLKFGGVRKCIESFIRTLKQVSGRGDLGYKQEAVIRNLLTDVFANFGFHADNPDTWAMNELDGRLVSGGADNRLYLEVPIEEKDEAKSFGARWDNGHRLWWIPADRYEGGAKKWKPAIRPRRYPSIKDVAQYCEQLYRERFLGSEQEAMRALDDVNRKAKTLQRKKLAAFKSGYQDPTIKEDTETLEEAKENCKAAFAKYLDKVTTGDELNNLLKYEDAKTLKGVLDRLEGMMRSGVFSAQAPKFDPNCRIWRYKLDSLFDEEKKMFVLFSLHQLFRESIQGGERADVETIVVLDELHALLSSEDEKGDGIIGKIAREARKYGMGLWGATQQLSGIPEGLMTSVATIVNLGISSTYFPTAVTKLGVPMKMLQFVQPHSTLIAQVKEKGGTKAASGWKWLMHKPQMQASSVQHAN